MFKNRVPRKMCSVWGFALVLLTGYCLDDEIEEIVIGGACGTYGGEEKIE